MASPRIVPYEPTAAVRSRRIDPKEWHRHRPRLEQLYIKDDKKLEEVMEIMALYDNFHASRRQYTQKFTAWGFSKNLPGKVMKSALRKRALAGHHDISIKFRGTAIAKENLDRWQKRVPSFNPLSSPTASTPSQMDVESPFPHALHSQHPGDTRQSPSMQSPLVAVSELVEDGDDDGDDDDMMRIAYGEISRSVSPAIAEYVFQPKEKKSSSTRNNLVEAKRTFDGILGLSIAELNLKQMTPQNKLDLEELGRNLWDFGKNRYGNYCVHIFEILLARAKLLDSKQVWTDDVDKMTLNLSLTCLGMNRTVECEKILTDAIAKIVSSRPGDPFGDELRSLLGRFRSNEGQYAEAENLCLQAIRSLRSSVGLAHRCTWSAYRDLHHILGEQNRSHDQQRLLRDFYNDAYRTTSTQLLPALREYLELCEKYIEEWLPESTLQRILSRRYIDGAPLGVFQRCSMVLRTVFVEAFQRDLRPRKYKRLSSISTSSMVGSTASISANIANLISQRVKAVGHLNSSLIRQRALEAMRELKRTKFLVPLWIFGIFNWSRSMSDDFDWKKAEDEMIQSVGDADSYGIYHTDTSNTRSLTSLRRPPSSSVMADSQAINYFDSSGNSERSMTVSIVDSSGFSLAAGIASLGVHSNTAMPSTSYPTCRILPGPPLTNNVTQPTSLVSIEHMVDFTYPANLSWSLKQPISQSPSPRQSRQLSENERSQNWFSPIITFSQPTSPIQGRRAFEGIQANDWTSPSTAFPQYLPLIEPAQVSHVAPPHNGFSPTMMSTPTPPFAFSTPQTPYLFNMSPPRELGLESPAAAAPSSVLVGLRDFSVSPNLFTLHLSPPLPSSSLASDSSPRY